MPLTYISQQLTIYFGSKLPFTNGITLYIFPRVRTYRQTPYFGIDLTHTSNSWRKIRQFVLFTFSLITLSCSCLATIDQYFGTSQNGHLRRFNNIKLAH